jgi:cyclic di-GMP phosphodiesterase
MHRYATAIMLLTITQCCCVAIGLFIYDQYIVATVSQAAGLSADDVAALIHAQPQFRGLVIFWIVGLQSLAAFLTLSRLFREQARREDHFRVTALSASQDLLHTRNGLIFGLANLSESRDPETGRHLERIAEYSTRLATELLKRGQFPETVTRQFVKMIGFSATLHDIGKVSVDDRILKKTGELTAAERSEMQAHTVVGSECLQAVERRIGKSGILQMARQIARSHHEHWDGSGYPDGLAGDAIPLAARIVAIADVYDALSVRRCYKEPVPHHECVEMIRSGSGRQFDPRLVEVFLSIEREFRDMSRRLSPGRDELAAEIEIPQSLWKIADVGLDETPDLAEPVPAA